MSVADTVGGNFMTQDMNFSEALVKLKSAGRISRAGWNGKKMYLYIQLPTGGVPNLPYIMMRTAEGDYVPWMASTADLFAEDWGTA